MKTLILLPVYSVLLGGGLFTLSERTGAMGIGHKTITLHFVVLDATDSSHITGPVVRLCEVDSPETITDQAETSTQGKAEITREFTIISVSGRLLHRDTAVVRFYNWNVEVSAPGYKKFRCWLPHFTGQRYDLEFSPPAPMGVVKLERLDTRQ